MGSNELAMIGLAVRAGKALFGTAACENGIRRKKVRLLVMQERMSPSSKKGFEDLCRHYGTDIMTISGDDTLGAAVGRPGIMVVGITDTKFSDAIRNNIGGSGKE